MAARIRNALVLYRPIRGLESVEIRLHRTILYNSIYRADDQYLINTHVYGTPAAEAPVLHLRKVAGGDMVATYAITPPVSSTKPAKRTAVLTADGMAGLADHVEKARNDRPAA